VNLLFFKPTLKPVKRDLRFQLSVGVLNFNTQFGFNHEGNNVTFGFGRNVFLGWDPNEDELRQKIKPIWRDYSWNPKEQYFANLSFYRRINSQSNIHVKFNAFWESILNKLNPSSTFSRIVFDENYSNQRYVLGLTHTQKIDKSLELVSNLNGTIFQRTVKNFSQNLTNRRLLFMIKRLIIMNLLTAL
jgi:hypothetical protein